jgi:hypothetical protein
MMSNDNRNRIFGASLVFAGIVGLIAPPLPAARLCPAELLSRAGIRVSFVAPPAPPHAPRAPQARVITARALKMVLPTL